MKIFFMGTPQFALPPLEALCSYHQVIGVITQPDKPKGRNLKLLPSPVKKYALERGLTLFQPDNLNDQGFLEEVKKLSPEVIVVAAYGKIIPKALIELPKIACFNIHPSLLPKYRGAAPIQRAIMGGEKETGVTIMKMEEGLDSGPILLQEKVKIELNDTSGTLERKLSQLGARLILEALERIKKGDFVFVPQDESKATFAPKIEKGEALINWSVPAKKIVNLVRALNPYPGAFTFYQGKRLKIWKVEIINQKSLVKPGVIISANKNDGLVITTSDFGVRLLEVQPENKNKMSDLEFICGYPVKLGETLMGGT